jgi:hypothetical protein
LDGCAALAINLILRTGDDCGQGIAEYAMMAAVTITIVIGILALVGVHAKEVFFAVKRVLR